MMFTYFDVVLLLLLAICIGIGAYRGLIGSLIKIFGRFARIVLAFLLCRPMSNLVSSITRIDERMFDKYHAKAIGISDKFSVTLSGMNEDQLNQITQDALSDASIPKLFRGLFKKVFAISPETISQHESITLADLMGAAITSIILIVGSFVFLYLLFLLLCFFASRWSRRLMGSNTIFARTNRWLGAFVGLVRAVVILFVGFVIIGFIEDFGWFESFTMKLNDSLLSGPLYRLVNKFLDNTLNLQEIVTNWIKK